MIKYLYHFSTSLDKRAQIINEMKTETRNTVTHVPIVGVNCYFTDANNQRLNLKPAGPRHRRQHQLRHAVTPADGECLRAKVDHDDLQFAAIVAVDGAGRVGHGHPVLQGEVPLDIQLKTEMEQAPGVAGHEQKIQVPRAAPHQMPRAPGFPAVREFATFRELNMGQVRETGKRTGHIDFTRQGDSYESFRRATNGKPENLY
jgi:hypothetical protein